jgi:predicted GNAT family N-acyltransferase
MSNTNQASISVAIADSDESYNHVFNIRTTVFVDEVSVDSEDEYDGFDHLATHYLATYNQVPAGTSRWRYLPTSRRIRLERVAVLKSFRRKGIGTALMKRMLTDIPHSREIYVHVQPEFADFFTSLGFVKEGDSFEEAGLEHYKMILQSADQTETSV